VRVRNLAIENFRAIKRLVLDDLADMVVIAGPNGCGKTQIYHAIRLLKSTYGGYQPNEFAQWWGEFQIKLGRPGPEIYRIFRDRRKPIHISATLEFDAAELDYLRSNAANSVRTRIWQEIAPGIDQAQITGGGPALAQAQRVHGAEVARRIAGELELVNQSLNSRYFVGELIVRPNLQYEVAPNPALELAFSTYEPEQLGVIDYHGAQRNYNREQLGGINLSIKTSEDRFKQHVLYNWQNKYSNVKSELAAGYVRDLIAAEAGVKSDKAASLTATLQELFATFFPGKTFLGPTAGVDGTLDFPVRLEGGAEHDIDDLSSGEKEVLFGYLRLRNNAPKNSVVLIDEPELHLNPALLRGFPDFYHRHIGRDLGNQLWLVTHSDALLREAVGQQGFSVYHMQSPDACDQSGNQLQKLDVGELLDRAIVDLVGDLATYRPGAKVVIFEGGGDSEFDVRMTTGLFPKFADAVNVVSAGHRSRVEQLHELLRKASAAGKLGAKFFSIVDRDSGMVERAADSFQWDRYHIENYLLEPEYILAALRDLNLVPRHGMTVDDIRAILLTCARETLASLVRHELETDANTKLVSMIKTATPRNQAEVAPGLHDALLSSRARIDSVLKEDLALDKLAKTEAVLRNRFAQDLKTDAWLSSFRGRDILKRFIDHHVKAVSYEVFRDLILARMRDVGWQPPGMRKVLESISAA
jgi:energy-coupling factor transporter ATP-binding protein EcfA2